MGFFTDFIMKGFSKRDEELYEPGQLYELMSKLGESLKPDEMKNKVKTLLGGWSVPASTFRKMGLEIPVYALEMHAVNDKDNPHNGYGTFIFVPDSREKMVLVPAKSIFSEPIEYYDDEDPLKMISSLVDSGEMPSDAITVHELICEREDFLPMNVWGRDHGNDPIEELFGVFDSLPVGAFAGLSVVLTLVEDGYDEAAKMRIRSIEDPEYDEDSGIIGEIDKWISGKPSKIGISPFRKTHDLAETSPDFLSGYKKKQLSKQERDLIEKITKKIESDLFKCTIRVYASDPSTAETLSGLLVQKTGCQTNGLVVSSRRGSVKDLALRSMSSDAFMISSDEVSTIWHVPAENTGGEKRHQPLPAAMTPPDEVISFDAGDEGDIRYLFAMMSGQ